MVTYINNQELLSNDEKYEYVKVLRTQLTNSEQKLLFLNAFFKYGDTWEFKFRNLNQSFEEVKIENRKYLLITKFGLIKNLPKGLVLKDVSAHNFFPDIEFESN